MGVRRSIGGVQPFAELFQGATTLVYKGYQRSLDRFVLLKILRPEVRQDEALARRFEEEARLVAKVQHPNVVAIYDYGQEEQDSYIVAEYVEGVNLEHLIQAAGKLPWELAAFILLEAAKGLQAAHRKGILHRDIKPANILISCEGQVKLADFGMASLASAEPEEEVRGTMAYFAPEQVLGEGCSQAADLFSLGATFYEMLAGRRAFSGTDARSLFDVVLHHDPLPLVASDTRLPPALLRILRSLLEKDPGERLQDAAVLVAQLEAFRMAEGSRVGAAALKAYFEDPDAYHAHSEPPGDGDLLPVVVHGRMSTTLAGPLAAPPRVWENSRVPEPVAPGSVAGVRSGRSYRRMAFAVLVALLISAIGYAGIVRFEAQERTDAAHERALQRLQEEIAADTNTGDAQHPSSPEEPSAAPLSSGSDENPSRTTRAEIAPEPGALRVDARPWAMVFLNGDSIGTTPVSVPLLQAGSHEVLLRRSGFPDYRTTVYIDPGQEEKLDVELWNSVGKLMLLVNPWAEVFIDGRYRDTTPLERALILTPGQHRLMLRHPLTRARLDTTFTLSAGDSLVLTFRLDERLIP